MRPPLDIKAFCSAIDEDISRGYKFVSELEDWAFAGPMEPDEDRDVVKMQFRTVLERIHERLAIALEYSDLPNALARVTKRFEARESTLTSLERIPYIDVLYSPVLSELVMAYGSFAACLGGMQPSKSEGNVAHGERQLLERILRGTAKWIADHSLTPNNEGDVRREIYSILLHVFPDTVRELRIPQVSKTYKPDIGVPHLESAVEYKFCDSEGELKKNLGGIYEDTKGYSGSKDWTNFYSVIYCTDVFMTEDQLSEELLRIGMPGSWKIMLVTGRGERRQKTSEKKGKNSPTPSE